MTVVKEEPTSGRVKARNILRKYMADFTTSTSVPTRVKGGFFAFLIQDTGQVWLGEVKNFKTVMERFVNRVNMAHVVEEAIKRGSGLELWFLTQPERFSAQALEDELFQADLLADRKERDLKGPGKLYCIRHDVTLNYFITADRAKRTPESVLGNFYRNLQTTRPRDRNKALGEFISQNLTDITRLRGFSITPLESFVDRDDEIRKRQAYIDTCTYGKNLNFVSVE